MGAAVVNDRSDPIRFVLDCEDYVVEGVQPSTTVLQYLREQHKRTGTKEGCAEGDCGACTVVLAELDGDAIRYRPVNSCIQFLPTLDGKVLFTVESLKKIAAATGQQLHSVQQAMVDEHGSQCGFCTPGFVMSLFALYMTNKTPSKADIQYALSGNLCRCTGYRPILDAANQMYTLEDPTPASFEQDLRATLDRVRVSGDKQLLSDECQYYAPASIESLSAMLAEMPDATILAGGTDIGLWVTKQYKELPKIIYVGNISELREITPTPESIEIAAAVSLSDAWPVLLDEYPDFAEIVRRFASPPICNSGTLCGNVANGSPIGDTMPGLIALGAEVRLHSVSGERVLPLESFYLGYMQNELQPGEFVRSVRIPRAGTDTVFRSYKISKRYDQDISAVCAAFAIRIDDDRCIDARVCFGGMAAIPKRASACEQALRGAMLNGGAPSDELLDKACEALLADFEPITDMRASAEYRQQVAGNLVHRFLADVQQHAMSVWDYAEQRA